MAEPISEQIMVAIRAHLAGIAGTGGSPYWYTPDVVIRVPDFHGGCLDRTYDVIYVIASDRIPKNRETTRTKLGRISFDVIAVKRLPPEYSDLNPFAAQPGGVIRETYQARLSADVERRLSEDPTLQNFPGLGISGFDPLDDDRSAEATAIEGWACAFLRWTCEYRYRFDTP